MVAPNVSQVITLHYVVDIYSRISNVLAVVFHAMHDHIQATSHEHLGLAMMAIAKAEKDAADYLAAAQVLQAEVARRAAAAARSYNNNNRSSDNNNNSSSNNDSGTGCGEFILKIFQGF